VLSTLRCVRPWFIVLAVALGPAFAWSQGSRESSGAALGIVPGARVRLTAADSGDTRQVGTVIGVHQDSVAVRREPQRDTLMVGFAHLTALELSEGRHAHPVTGLAIGFLGGAAIGAILAAAAYHKSTETCPPYAFGCGFGDFGAGANAAAGAILGAVGGAVVGVITGFIVHTERWRKVPLASLLARSQTGFLLTPSPTGLRLAMRIGTPL
jgi:hypothetical protein